jgi:hypothetical protein
MADSNGVATLLGNNDESCGKNSGSRLSRYCRTLCVSYGIDDDDDDDDVQANDEHCAGGGRKNVSEVEASRARDASRSVREVQPPISSKSHVDTHR